MSTLPATVDVSQTVKLALSRIADISTLPEVTAKIITVVDDPKSTARDLHLIIKNDPALASKILKVVKSAFYGLPGQISDLDRAIVLLGLSAVKNIAISASISRLFTAEKIADNFTARDLWKHSVAVAAVVRQFACLIGRRAFAEEAFLAGLIHDLGLLVERQAFPEQLAEVIQEAAKSQRTFVEIETDVVGADHQALGMALAAKWRFPRTLQIVLGYHHNVDNLSADHRPLPTLVCIADKLCCQERIGFPLTGGSQPIEESLLEAVGLTPTDIENLRAELPQHIETAEATLSD